MALSKDLRLRVVAAYKAGNEGYIKIAQRFGVAVCSVRRWVELFNITGSVDKRPQPNNNPSQIPTNKLPDLVALVREKPDRTAQELTDIWNERNGINISRSSMVRALKRANLSLKKKTFRSAERNKEHVQQKREEFLWELGQIPAEKLVFVDEAGVHLGMTPTYARALLGERVYAESANRGTNISLIGAVSLDGVNALYPYDGAVDGERFLSFLKEQLIPTLKIGDVVIMDNLRVHHIEPVRVMIEGANARLLYLPPYHPELNPIEEAWSKIKNIFRKAEARTISALVDVLGHAKKAVSKEDLFGYFKHAGYDPS